MSKSKHKPGPWIRNGFHSDGANLIAEIVTKNNKKRVCRVDGQAEEHLFETSEAQANANLIAAAPCLFDKLSVALERLKEKSDGSNRDIGLIQSIEKTLSKAKGGVE